MGKPTKTVKGVSGSTDERRVDEWPTPGEMLLLSIKLAALGLFLLDILLAIVDAYAN